MTAIWIITISIFGLVVCLLRPFEANNTPLLGRILGLGVLPLGKLKLHFQNREKFKDLNYPVVFISNHQHNYDAFIIGSFVPRKTVSIGKKVIRLFPFFGQIYWLGGNILIDRKRKKSALGTMKQAADKMRKKGINVWVMPEGTRSKGRGLLPFKKGAFHLATQTGFPIVPVSISNYSQSLNLSGFKKNHVCIKIHDPIEVKKLEEPDRDYLQDLIDQSQSILAQGIEEMDQLAKELSS